MKNIAIKPEDYTILAVDDIATNIMLLKAVLSRAKYKIVTASGGFEALEKVAAVNPDLILLDIMMPDLDGYEVLKRLKADPAHEDIPVIFLTALHNPEDIVKGFKFGASDYISKPFNHEELITRVAHHIYLAAAQRTIMQQRDELQATVEARDKMYSVIAHDLRSPIGTLKMVFNMLSINLSADQIGEDSFEMISMGNNITESTFMLLDNLLKWAKNRLNKQHVYKQQTDINSIIDSTAEMYIPMAAQKGVKIILENLDKELVGLVDIDMLKTIIRNLISNAMKFSFEGGTITLSSRSEGDFVTVSVKDTGKGIKKEDQDKLLKQDSHFTTYGTKNEKGSGLGLMLCKDFVELHGGKLWFESEGEGKGTTFLFSMKALNQEA